MKRGEDGQEAEEKTGGAKGSRDSLEVGIVGGLSGV